MFEVFALAVIEPAPVSAAGVVDHGGGGLGADREGPEQLPGNLLDARSGVGMRRVRQVDEEHGVGLKRVSESSVRLCSVDSMTRAASSSETDFGNAGNC